MRTLPLRVAAACIMPVVIAVAGWAAEPRYQMHYMGTSCVIGPCPQWQVTDSQTGEKFVAVVDLSGIVAPPSNSHDLLAEARRVRRERPNGGGGYDMLAVTRIIEAKPAVPGYRP